MKNTAAIYCRKSTDQSGVAADEKSVVRQEAHARAFVAAKGWHTSDDLLFVDDGVSGAEFEKRPGLQRMLAAAQRHAFSFLVVSEQKSLGREAYQTQYLLKQLAEAGVEVWAYMEARSLTPKNAMDKAMSSLRAFGDEAHREDTSKRGHESHASKHRRGHVVGGRVFGYRNVDVLAGTDAHGRSLRSHVERMIDDAEAVVVRRIFALYDSGLGLKSIAKALTLEGACTPKPFVRAAYGLPPVTGWAPSTVRAVLGREDYRGVYVWNRTRKRTEAWGKIEQRPRPESEWQRTEMPQWRIVSDELWNRVAARRKAVEGTALRFGSGRLSGRPPKHAAQNLLAGLAACGVCGGGLVAETYKTTAGKPRASHYVCNRRRLNGGCSNRLRIPVEQVNEAVLVAVEEHALTPEAIEQVIELTERDDLRERENLLRREQTALAARIDRLVAAIEAGGDAASLVAKLRELEAKARDTAAEIAGLRPLPRLEPAVVETRLGEWRRLLRQSPTQGRAVLQRVLDGRVTFTPRGDGYDFSAPTRFDRLFSGVAVKPLLAAPEWMTTGSTTGLEHLQPEDLSFDADYGELLEKALNRKWMASPPGFEPGF